MSWHESECPVCSENTSGTLPYPLTYRVKIYPCKEHYETICDKTWQKDYLSRCSTVKYCHNCKKWSILKEDDCPTCGEKLHHTVLKPGVDAKKVCEDNNKPHETHCHFCGKDSTGFKPFLMPVSKHVSIPIYPCTDHVKHCRNQYQPWSEANA